MSSQDLPDSYKQAIGSLVVEVARLESVLTDMIGSMSGMKDLASAFIVAHHKPISAKVQALQALFNREFPEDSEQLKSWLGTLDATQKVISFRNTVVHSYWHMDDDGTAKVMRLTARGKLEQSSQPVSLAEIKEHTITANVLCTGFAAVSGDRRRGAKFQEEMRTKFEQENPPETD